MNPVILTLNAGSSSLKSALYQVDTSGNVQVMIKGRIDRLQGRPLLTIQADTEERRFLEPLPDPSQAINQSFNLLLAEFEKFMVLESLVAVGHRVVHGGMIFDQATDISGDILEQLKAFNQLAPQHQPYNLMLIEKIAQDHPDLVQVACFDTAFHTHQPKVARKFAIPKQWTEEGILRYGFHGLSYDYIAQTMPSILGEKASQGKAIIAHLGHGASLCALHHLQSVATTMGFSALDGLPMGTRCGALDPGVIFYLAHNKGLTLHEIEHILYHQSGLLGISGVSGDVQELLESDCEAAKQAIEYFVYRIVQEIGALTFVLQGLDHLIFTAGIGENASSIRKLIGDQLRWLGCQWNEVDHRSGARCLTKRGSHPAVWVIPTNEELVIAQQTAKLWRSCSSIKYRQKEF